MQTLQAHIKGVISLAKFIGAQYYTIRDYCKTIEDFELSCKKIHAIGYKIVQISGVSLEADKMREVLDKYDLKCVVTHRAFDDFLTNIDEVIAYNKILGSDICGVGIMPDRYLKSNSDLDEFIRGVNIICARLESDGLLFGYHNHSVEFIKLGGKLVMDRLIEETNPETFNFIVDVYWLQVGGVNPSEFIKKLGKRVIVTHFKDYLVDINNWTVPQMTHIGNGNLDWDKIINSCEAAGCRWAIVEQDSNWIESNPFLALEESYKFLNTKGFM